MFIFYVFVAALIWAGVSYWLHKNKPLKNAGEVQQVYLIRVEFYSKHQVRTQKPDQNSLQSHKKRP